MEEDWDGDNEFVETENLNYGLWFDDFYPAQQVEYLTERQQIVKLYWNRENHYRCMQMSKQSKFEGTEIADNHDWSLCHDLTDLRPGKAEMDYCIYRHLDHSDDKNHVCHSMTSYLKITKGKVQTLRALAYFACPIWSLHGRYMDENLSLIL
jgi:hypothetical protein